MIDLDREALGRYLVKARHELETPERIAAPTTVVPIANPESTMDFHHDAPSVMPSFTLARQISETPTTDDSRRAG